MSGKEDEYDSDNDSLDNINEFDGEALETPEEVEKVASVREAVRDWKNREMDKHTTTNANAKSLKSLREYVSNSATLYYDLNEYMTTSRNKESNMKDSLYVAIVSAIGTPGFLPYPLRVLLDRLLERDLVELPFTVEPQVINSYAKKSMKASTDFPDEE